MPTLDLALEAVERTRAPLESASQLPAAAFTDPAVLDWELESLFGREWVCAGHVGQLPERGRYLTVQLGEDNLVVIADDDGLPRAFLNSCRHRGARLLLGQEGATRRIQCPYHAWCYGFDGSLKKAPFTDGLDDFDPAGFGLHQVRIAVIEGLILLNLSGDAPPPDLHVGDLRASLARYRLADLRRAARKVYDVDANWKAIGENYSECLHCPGVHPELNRLSHYLSGEDVPGEGAWCGGSMTLSEGAATMARNGGAPRPAIAGVDPRAVLYFLLFPNTLVSLHPDYVMLHTLWPRSPDRTEVVCDWLFEPETMDAAGFDPADAVEFWDQVNREDWEVCRLTQLGMHTRGYVPGRYTTEEGDVHRFDVMVANRYREALVR
jgi:Rieske 2Fe-2S family protein